MDSPGFLIVMLVLIGGMFYLSSRTRKKQLAAQKAKIDAIVPGVLVTTIAGLRGTVISTTDETMELEIAPGVHTTWLRAAIRDVVVAPDASDAVDLEAAYQEDSHVSDGVSLRKDADDTDPYRGNSDNR